MISNIILFFTRRIIRSRKLELWKEEKREKWLKEGKSNQEVERELRKHKVKWLQWS